MKNPKILNFKGLYGDNTSFGLPDFIQYEPLASRSKRYDWEIQEHLHAELFQIFIIHKGEGILTSEKKQLTLKAPCTVIIPANTLHGFHFEPDIDGEVFTFSESYLENTLKHHQGILQTFTSQKIIDFRSKKKNFDLLNVYKNQIIEELFEEELEKKTNLQLLFQLLFIQLLRADTSSEQTNLLTGNRTLKHFQDFIKLLKKNRRSMEEYAQELGITTVHLNRVCQKIVQKTAVQVVNEYIIGEAKRYLLNTSYSISEISYFLNFNDPAYFTRLFKKVTGVSPSEFRKN